MFGTIALNVGNWDGDKVACDGWGDGCSVVKVRKRDGFCVGVGVG